MMWFLRSGLFCMVAVTFLCQIAHADVDDSLVGRWQHGEAGEESEAPFTMDIVRCGEKFCAVMVEGRRCGAVVLEPYVAPGGKAGETRSGTEKNPEYRFKRPESKEEFVAQLGIVDAQNFWLVGVPTRQAGTGWISRRWFPLKLWFHRIGNAECGISAPTS